jgi:hypothetical protein
MCPVGRQKDWRAREDGQAVFKDAALISADTLPQRTEQSDPIRLHLVGLPLAGFADASSIFVGLWLSESDSASVDSYCVS